MRTLPALAALCGALLFTSASFAQSVDEEAKDAVKDTKRDVKKATNRAKEKACVGTKEECARKKLEHRGHEAKDAVEDKADELKDKAD